MGIDFVKKVAPSFEKSWDKGAIEASTADIFTQHPESVCRIAVADISKNAVLRKGEKIIITFKGESLIASRGLIEVAQFTNPSQKIVEAVRSSCGIGKGVVEKVYDQANVVEISIC